MASGWPTGEGVLGHTWRAEQVPGSGELCRAACECGWESLTGQRESVLWQVRAHLEGALRGGAARSRGPGGPAGAGGGAAGPGATGVW